MKNRSETIAIPRLYVPVDDDGFSQSFVLDQIDEAKAFFDEYGFVVMDGMLNEEEIAETISEIYDILESDSDGFDRNDVSTWSNFAKNGMSKWGTISRPSIFTPQFLRNRMNRNIYNACREMLQDDNILVSHDRACFYRPTKDVVFPDGTVKDMRQWKTGSNIHLDVNPFNYLADHEISKNEMDRLDYNKIGHWIMENNYPTQSHGVAIQCSINLFENREEDGGFLTIPGFHKVFASYFNIPGRAGGGRPSYIIDKNDELNKFAQRITMRAGSIVIWDQRMIHGSRPNNSDRPRAAQFFRFFKKEFVSERRAEMRRRSLIQLLFRLDGTFEIAEEDKHVLGLNESDPTVYGMDHYPAYNKVHGRRRRK